MSYEEKHLINSSQPDGLDLDECPVKQAWEKEQQLKTEMKSILIGDIDEYFRKTTETTSSF